MEEITISINICDRNLRLTIDRHEEEIVRKAAKMINEKVKEFGQTYEYKDKLELLSMVALIYASHLLNYEKIKTYNDSTLKTKLNELNDLLDMHLEKN